MPHLASASRGDGEGRGGTCLGEPTSSVGCTAVPYIFSTAVTFFPPVNCSAFRTVKIEVPLLESIDMASFDRFSERKNHCERRKQNRKKTFSKTFWKGR